MSSTSKNSNTYSRKDWCDWRSILLATVLITSLNLTVWHVIYGSGASSVFDILVVILGAIAQSFIFGSKLFGHERLLSRYSERRNATILGDLYEERKKIPSLLDQLGREQLFVRFATAGIALAGCFYLLGQYASILSFNLGLMIAFSFLIDIFWAPILVSAAFLFAGALSVYGGISGSLMAVGSLVCIEICFFQWLVFRIKESDRIPGNESPASIFTSEWVRPAGILVFLLVLSFFITPTLDYRQKENKPKGQKGLGKALSNFVWYMGKSPAGGRGRTDAGGRQNPMTAFTPNQPSSSGEGEGGNPDLKKENMGSSGRGAGTNSLPLTKPTIDLPLQPKGGSISSQQLQRLLNTNISMPQQLGGGKLNMDSLASFDKGAVEIRLSGSPVSNQQISDEYYELARDLMDFREMQGSLNPQPQLQKRLQQSIKQKAENLQKQTTNQDLSGVKPQIVGRQNNAEGESRSSKGAPPPGNQGRGGASATLGTRVSAEKNKLGNQAAGQQDLDDHPRRQVAESQLTQNKYEQKKEQQKEKRRRRDLLMVVAATVLVLGVIWLGLRGQQKRDKEKRARPKKLSGRRLKAARSAFHQHLFEITQRYPTLAEQVIAAYNGLLGFYRMIGLEKPLHFTPDEYMHVLSSRLPQKRQPLNQVTGIFLHTLYGRQEPTQAMFQQYMLAIRELSKIDKM